MKRYLAWNRSEQVCPAIASSPPPSAFAGVPFNLNGITSCPSTATTASFFAQSDTTNNFLSAVVAAAQAQSDSNSTTNSSNIFLEQNTAKTFLGPDNNSFTPHSPQITTSALNRHQPQLSAAAAEYLLAAAFASNTSQLACPSTSYQQPITPLQQPPTPQQQFDSLFVQYNQEQNFQRQSAATTAALVAALQQRHNQQQNHEIQHHNGSDNADQRLVNTNGNVDLFATGAQTSNSVGDNNASSIVAQLSSSTIPRGNNDGPLANSLANVCAAAAVTVNAQPASIDNVGSSSVLSTTSIVQPNGKSSSTPIILNSLTAANSTLGGGSPIDSPKNLSATTHNSFLSPQHSSAFQLVSPLSQQNQNSPNIGGINFLQQHHLQNQVRFSPTPLSPLLFLYYL